jgi:hypothetical protein
MNKEIDSIDEYTVNVERAPGTTVGAIYRVRTCSDTVLYAFVRRLRISQGEIRWRTVRTVL